MPIAYSPDGGTLASGDTNGTIHLWSLRTGNERSPWVGHEGPVYSLAYSMDDTILASGGGDDHES